MSRLLLCVWLWLLAAGVWAQDCTRYFPDALQSNTNSGRLTFQWQARVIGSPDNVLDAGNITDNAGPGSSCNGVSCTASGTPVLRSNYNSFPNNNNDVTVNAGQTLTLSPGIYDNITVNSSATLNLQSGTYTLRGTLNVYSGGVLNLVSGTVRLLVRENVNFNFNSQINAGGDAAALLIYSRANITLISQARVHGFLYARGDVTLGSQAQVVGAIAGDDVTLNSPATVTYAASLASADFAPFCTPVLPPDPVADYQLEQLMWNGTAGEVEDSSGHGLHGRAVPVSGNYPTADGSLPALAGDPGTCRYGEFNGPSRGYLQVADSSLLDLPDALTVTAWIYPTSLPTGGDLYSIVSKDENFEFHLASNRRIYWWWGGGSRALYTGNNAVALNAWNHVAITYESGAQKIYVNGVEQASASVTGPLTLNNDPLLIGSDLSYNTRNFRGRIDEVKIYDAALSATQLNAVMNQTRPCTAAPVLGSFLVDVGATASVCSGQQVTITALDNLGQPFANYVGNVALTSSTGNGNWSLTNGGVASGDPGLGTLVPGGGDSGQASYSFVAGDAGSVALFLSNQHAETQSLAVLDTTVNGSTGTGGPVTFSENAFVFSFTDPLANDVVAGRDHGARVEMVRRDPVTGRCGVASDYSVGDIKFWLTRHSQDPGGTAPSVRTAASTVSLPAAEPGGANVSVPFVAGVGDFQLRTGDVGKYTLHVKDDSGSFSDQPIVGDSGTQVVRPFAFDIRVGGNPAAQDAFGPAFMPAGQNFTATVRALLWESVDDVNDDGMADGHGDGDPATGANLQDNAAAASYGLENLAEGIRLSAQLVSPVGGVDPGLGNSDSPGDGRLLTGFAGGQASSGNLHFAEVGVIELNSAVADGDYLVSGARAAKILGSTYVGRFTPAAFVLSDTGLTEACTGFSYMEQPFSGRYRLTAVNALAAMGTTANYQGNYAKLASGGNVVYGARGAGVDLSTRLTGATTTVNSWISGAGDIVLNSLALGRQLSTAPEAPIDPVAVGVQVTDTDGISLAPLSLDLDVNADGSADYGKLGDSLQRFGRVHGKDAFGPESADIPMFWQTEYYDGNRFVPASDDYCTQIAFSQINIVGASISLDVANRILNVDRDGIVSRFNFGDHTGGLCGMTLLDLGFCGGQGGRWYGATGRPVTYTIQVNLNNYPHLRFDWDGDGNHSDATHPDFDVIFQSYRGHDRVIFWRERL